MLGAVLGIMDTVGAWLMLGAKLGIMEMEGA